MMISFLNKYFILIYYFFLNNTNNKIIIEDNVVLGLEINVEEIGDKIILRLHGRLDAPSSNLLEKKLNSLIQDKRKIVFLDFGDLVYLSSSGLRLLLSFTKKFHEINFKLGIFSVQDNVFEIIRITGFEHILHIYHDEKTALSEKIL